MQRLGRAHPTRDQRRELGDAALVIGVELRAQSGNELGPQIIVDTLVAKLLIRIGQQLVVVRALE
jgi:hypothetical protein